MNIGRKHNHRYRGFGRGLRISRTLLALLLVLPAISVPCVAWYFAGTRAAEEDADRLADSAQLGAFNVAMGLAQRLEGHLQALSESETRRPFYHYQPHYHDPTSSCECASITLIFIGSPRSALDMMASISSPLYIDGFGMPSKRVRFSPAMRRFSRAESIA